MSLGPLTIGVPSRRLNEPPSRKRHDDVSLNTTVECAAVARATCRQVSRLVVGRPQFTTMRCNPCDSSNDRQPACASLLTLIGGGPPESISTTNSPTSTRLYPASGGFASAA